MKKLNFKDINAIKMIFLIKFIIKMKMSTLMKNLFNQSLLKIIKLENKILETEVANHKPMIILIDLAL